ncbi:M43 family zinc metalloprotease [Hymenobacter sp. UYCo722]|uniref:M43 family zinc metalloprotease n=1 Tax=Hymenobacter sp. UYCo722 TaxID=3156335 RepID=UPI003396F6D9
MFNKGSWELASTVNHELCHVLGLNHPFQYNDFAWGECADAPMNANCWTLSTQPGNTDCSSWSQVSNNLMDYNTFQTSLAPCQIGIIQNNLNTCLAGRYVYKCSNCLPVTATFDVTCDRGCKPTPVWLESRAAANYDWYQLSIDRLYHGIASAGEHFETAVYGQKLGRAQLNALYPFRPSGTYRIKLVTGSYCSASTTAVQVRYLRTPDCP